MIRGNIPVLFSFFELEKLCSECCPLVCCTLHEMSPHIKIFGCINRELWPRSVCVYFSKLLNVELAITFLITLFIYPLLFNTITFVLFEFKIVLISSHDVQLWAGNSRLFCTATVLLEIVIRMVSLASQDRLYTMTSSWHCNSIKSRFTAASYFAKVNIELNRATKHIGCKIGIRVTRRRC